MGLIHPSRSRAPAVVLTALGLALVIVALVQRTPINAATGSAGPATVTVTPTDDLTNGQAVAVSATFAAGSVSEMRVHLCAHDAGISNTFDFDLDGPFCSPNKVSPEADVQKFVAVAPSDTSASILGDFKVGIGTGAAWGDVLGGTHTLTCDSTHQCDIVVQFQITGGQSWFAAPLTFAGGATTTTSPGTTTTTSPGTTTTTSPDTTTTTSPDTTSTTSTTTTSTTTSPDTTSTTSTTTTSTTTTSTTVPDTTTTTSPDTTTTTDPGSTTTTSPGTTTTTDPGGATTTTTVPVVVGAGGTGTGGTGTGGTGTPTAGAGSGGLALTGVNSRDLASVALLLIAGGLLMLSLYYRRSSAA